MIYVVGQGDQQRMDNISFCHQHKQLASNRFDLFYDRFTRAASSRL
jgi:hypothetical protein